MELKKENLVAYKHLSGLEVAGLNQFFDAAAAGDADATFRFGLRMYNQVGLVNDDADRDMMRKQAAELIADAAVRGSKDARNMISDLVREADRAAALTDIPNGEGPALRL